MPHTKHTLDPIRITPEGGHFFFGYYDRQPMTSDGRYHLALRPPFMDRPNTGADKAELGIIDLANDNAWAPLDDTVAWNWQMAANQQWLGSAPDSEFICNIRAGNKVFSRIRNIVSGDARDLPMPIYDVSRDGKWAMSVNFARIHHNRPGYGYPDLRNRVPDIGASDEDGLWRMDLATGKTKLVFTLAQAATMEHDPSMDGVPHWFNHVMISPKGTRVMMLYRWKPNKITDDRGEFALSGGNKHQTRLITCNPDGSEPYILNRGPVVSHSDWRDDEHIISFCNHVTPQWAYYLHTDRTQEAEEIGNGIFDPGRDGHCHYYPRDDKRWFITDTYPEASEKGSENWGHDLILYDTQTDTRVDIARLDYMQGYEEEIRCDAHSRWDTTGNFVTIDSIHEGFRGIYLMDVSGIV